jgi:hypothetical protein
LIFALFNPMLLWLLLVLTYAGIYEQLLAKRGPLLEDAVPGAGVVLGGSGDGASRNALRLRLLASLAAHCRIVVREELAPGLVAQVRRCVMKFDVALGCA